MILYAIAARSELISNFPPETPAPLLVLGLAGAALLALRLKRPHRLVEPRSAPREFVILPPPDNSRPAGQMLAEIANTPDLGRRPLAGLAAKPQVAALGRSLLINSREISYRDFCCGQLAIGHAARLERFYPGIRVLPQEAIS